MKRLLATTLMITGMMIAAVLGSGLAHAQSPKQVEWVGDLPVMPGLEIETGLGFAFDSPEGRIVTIYLSGDAQSPMVEDYYRGAMDPLGWVEKDRLKWQREGEVMMIQQVSAAGSQLWKLSIRPE
ncbi:MAG: Uncharacterised protein [SAR116 cluster bacterium MED-G04]|jgi:hypothetical protein|nr:MAG: Uncharacterised protein [SAR116 cluster bacterium MED-G04]|tara:strand:+ start:2970 stop:3344 length:375 start_codon:yes stop_codon:yes gene_type:complete